MTGDPLLDVCPEGHILRHVGIRCHEPGCGRFILLSPTVYEQNRARLFGHGFVLVLATLVAFALFDVTNEVWPLYLFLGLGIAFLYATVFSRGGALGHAAWFLAVVVLIWLVWESSGGARGIESPRARAIVVPLVSIVIWLVCTVFVYYLGSRNISAMRATGRYLVSTAAFTFGFWGVWAILLENDAITPGSYKIAIGLGLALPLICTAFLYDPPTRRELGSTRISRHSRRTRGMREWRLNLAAVSLVISAACLIAIDPLTRAVSVVLGWYFPRALGMPPLSQVAMSWLPAGQARASITALLLLLAVALVAVHSAMQVMVRTGRRPSPQLAEIGEDTTRVLAREKARERSNEGDHAEREEEPTLRDVPITDSPTATGRAIADATTISAFIGELGWTFLANMLGLTLRVVTVFVPVITFSVLSVLMMLGLGELHTYHAQGPFLPVMCLWGVAMTILVATMVLSGVAFQFAPYRTVRTASAPLLEVGAVALLGGLAYLLVSLASLGLLSARWLPLGRDGTGLAALAPGPLYFTNLAISVGTLGLVVLLYMTARLRWFRDRHEVCEKYLSASTVVLALALVATSLDYGADSIRTAVTFVSSGYDASAENSLRGLLPTSLVLTCRRDHLLLNGYRAGLSCRAAPGAIDVSYHLFATADQLGSWYAATLGSRGVTDNTGQCGRTSMAEHPYTNGHSSGRVACYLDPAKSWIIWTDTALRVLAIAQVPTGRTSELFASWSSGGLNPTPPRQT
jgi:hypothetical protein